MVTLYLISVSVLWAIFWSFASALIPRLREKRNMTHERSECPNCHHALSVPDLIPIFSFVFLLGKCRFCKAKIPFYHFALEITMATMFALVAYFLVDPMGLLIGTGTEWMKLAFLLASVFVAVTFTFYDILYMEIPDEVSLPFLILAFILLSLASFLPFDGFSYFLTFESETLNLPLVNAMLWACTIFLFFLVQILVSKGAWMGGWDLRIAVFMGFVAGAKIAWLWLFLSYFIGSIAWIAIMVARKGKDNVIPFGPYLAIWTFVALFFHESILNWYFSLANIAM